MKKNGLAIIFSLIGGATGKTIQILLGSFLLPPININGIPYFVVSPIVIFFIIALILGIKFPKNILNVPAGLLIGMFLAEIIFCFVIATPANEFTFIFLFADLYIAIPILIASALGYSLGEKKFPYQRH